MGAKPYMIKDPKTGELRPAYPKEMPLTPLQKDFLDRLYYEKMHMHGVKRLFDVVRRTRPHGIPRIYQLQVEKYLKNQEVYQLFKQPPKQKSSRQIYSVVPGQFVQVDLVDFTNRPYKNYKYLLTCVDVASRKAWVEPLIRKTASDVQKVITKLFDSFPPSKKVKTWASDNGTEFAFEIPGVKHIQGQAYNPKNQAIVERFNKTIKSMYFKHFEATGDKNWPEAMKTLVKNYNNTGKQQFDFKSPNEMYKLKDINELPACRGKECKLASIRKAKMAKVDKPIPKGAMVRYRLPKPMIKAKGMPLWSAEVYSIVKVIEGNGNYPRLYKLKNVQSKEVLPGTYNATQLQVIEAVERYKPKTKSKYRSKRK